MKSKYVQTDFIKFLLEKYTDEEGQEEEDNDEMEIPEDGAEESPHKFKKKLRKLNELEDEIPEGEEGGDDEEIIDELLNEYIKLKRKHAGNKVRPRRR